MYVSEIIHDHNLRTCNKPSLLVFWITCYKLSRAHARIFFFLLSTFYQSMATHTSCYFFEWMNECVVCLSVKGLGGEQSTWNVVVLPSFLGPPLLRRAKCCCGWPSVCRCTNGVLSLSALLLVQLFNYKIPSYTRFLHLWVKLVSILICCRKHLALI